MTESPRGGLIDALRSGAWLTRERVRLVAFAVLAASALGLGYLVATADGLIDVRGRPLGTDFSNIYAAGTYVLEGRPDAPFDPYRQHGRERTLFGEATPFYGWHYPPFFLFVAGALATMPYSLALAVWQGATLALYLLAMRGIVLSAPWPAASRPSTLSSPSQPQDVDARAKRGPDRLWIVVALAFPAVTVNLGHGHNGFLTAALMGFALVLLDRRPVASGVLFGLLAYKPQFGLMIPLVLAVTGRWRVFIAAAGTVALLAIATTLAFGPDVWSAFAASTEFTRRIVLEAGDTGWYKIQSVFAWVRMWGGPVALAYAVQGAVTVALGAMLVRLWRSDCAYALKAAALAIATMLATPYSLDYDMMVLAPAIAFLAAHGLAHGFAPWEKAALAALWLAPLLARSVAETTLVPLGVPAMLAVLALALRRATREPKMRGSGFPRPAH
jgi:hypothetical protein